MSVHTPGPWTVDPTFNGEVVLSSRGIMVADCSIFARGRSSETNQANARLIAATPDLLVALHKLLVIAPENALDDDDPEQAEAWAFARAVVAKLGID